MKGKKLILPLALGVALMGVRRLFSPGTVLMATIVLMIPVMFLWAMHRTETNKQRLAVSLVFTLGFALTFIGYSTFVWLDVLIFVPMGAYICLAYWADHRYGMERGFPGTLVFPCAWVTLYTLAAIIRLGFGYRFDGFVTASRSLNQLLSLVGSPGALFLLMWSSSVLTYVGEYIGGLRNKLSKAGLTVWIAIVAAAVIFGNIRLKTEKPEERSIRVAMGSSPYVGDFTSTDEPEYEVYTALLERHAAEAKEGGAELLMYHEEAFALDNMKQAEEFAALASELARKYGLHILIGEDIEVAGGEKDINRICWIDPNGEVLFSYIKYSVIPLIEAPFYVKGERKIPVIDVPFSCGNVRVASIICYDSNFSDYVKTIPQDTEILLIPSWDWKPVTEFHREISREIAVENGVTVVKNTYDGISAVIDPLGKTVFECTSKEVGFGVVTFTDVPVEGRKTVYSGISFYGQKIFAGLTIVAAIVLEMRIRRKKREVSL